MSKSIKTTKRTVSCSGDGTHPRVWFTFPANKREIVCNYCSARFELVKELEDE